METSLGPSLAELHFLPNTKKPFETWKSCVKAQEDWEKQFSFHEKQVTQMKEYGKKKTVQLVWLTNKLENTLPRGLNKEKVDEVLIQAYTDRVIDKFMLSCEPGLCQLVQHMQAFKYLCQKPKGSDSLLELSEDTIKQTHHIMMQGLKNEQGLRINAGAYRTTAVCAGGHVFPSYECIPDSMVRLVTEYNKKTSKTHDHYELASWLHFNIVSLHPFEDGNGRISQLLWCYSLMRDGLPFPTVLTSGRKGSQRHLIQCLNHDRGILVSNNPHLTTLTVLSVDQGWKEYFEMFR